jgi:polyphosphate glucokinase
VTFPGIVKKGIIYSATNVDHSWLHVDGSQLFHRHLGGPVHVVNDADAAGIAEMHFGAGRGKQGAVILLTFGTGIGSAVFYNGVLLPNAELGHLQLRGKDAENAAAEGCAKKKICPSKSGRKSLTNTSPHSSSSSLQALHHRRRHQQQSGKIPALPSPAKTDVLIQPAKMQNNAGIIGAALLAKIPS